MNAVPERQTTDKLLEEAHSLRSASNWPVAINSYRQVLAVAPDHPSAWLGLALCLEASNERMQARIALKTCLVIRPDAAFAHFRLGWLSYQEQNYEAAIQHCADAKRFAPDWEEPSYHAAACYFHLRRYPEAIKHFTEALIRKPDLPELWYHAAKTLKDAGRLDSALPAYARALLLRPEFSDARYSLGLLHLLRGDWLAGWKGYEQRWHGSDRAAKEHRPATALPLWEGEDVPAGSGVIVYSEQGMGDDIQCFRYAALLKDRFARVLYCVKMPLVSLFRQNAPAGVQVTTRIKQAIDETGYTHYIHSMSLGGVFKTTPTHLPNAPYLAAPSEREAFWHNRLANEARIKIGLVWMGGKQTDAPARDMPFEEVGPLLAMNNIAWISLQKEGTPSDALINDWMVEVTDFADTAALIANLDLVIAVDTAVAHLAGAMGKPVWLLNRFESEWRWMRGKTTTPWYPSMRIFTQPEPGAWGSIIRELRSDLVVRQATDPTTLSPQDIPK